MEVLRPHNTLVVWALKPNLLLAAVCSSPHLLAAVSAVHPTMSSLLVSGQVAIPHGRATLSLAPVQAHPPEACPRPSPDDILTAIEKGSIQVHPSRLPLKKKDVSNSLNNTQRHLYLTPGALGDWNARAQEHFQAMLLKPMRKSKDEKHEVPLSRYWPWSLPVRLPRPLRKQSQWRRSGQGPVRLLLLPPLQASQPRNLLCGRSVASSCLQSRQHRTLKRRMDSLISWLTVWRQRMTSCDVSCINFSRSERLGGAQGEVHLL